MIVVADGEGNQGLEGDQGLSPNDELILEFLLLIPNECPSMRVDVELCCNL